MQQKSINEFYNANHTKTGKQSMCIPCYKAYFKAWRVARSEAQAKMVVQSKVCLDCGLEKPISQFGKRSISPDKHNVYCKPCWVIRCKIATTKANKKKRSNAGI